MTSITRTDSTKPRKRVVSVCIAIPLLAGLCFGQVAGSRSDWTEFHRTNMERWNPYEHVLNVKNVGRLGLKWIYPTGVVVISSPAVVNGVVYVGSSGDPFHHTHNMMYINNKNQAVGISFPATGAGRAFIWRDGVITDLNSLIPPGSPLYLQEAFGINDRGQIAGFRALSDGDHRGFLLTPCDEKHADEGCEKGRGENIVRPTNTTSRDLLRRANRYHFPGRTKGTGD